MLPVKPDYVVIDIPPLQFPEVTQEIWSRRITTDEKIVAMKNAMNDRWQCEAFREWAAGHQAFIAKSKIMADLVDNSKTGLAYAIVRVREEIFERPNDIDPEIEDLFLRYPYGFKIFINSELGEDKIIDLIDRFFIYLKLGMLPSCFSTIGPTANKFAALDLLKRDQKFTTQFFSALLSKGMNQLKSLAETHPELIEKLFTVEPEDGEWPLMNQEIFSQSVPFLTYLIENHDELALRILSKCDSKGNTLLHRQKLHDFRSKALVLLAWEDQQKFQQLVCSRNAEGETALFTPSVFEFTALKVRPTTFLLEMWSVRNNQKKTPLHCLSNFKFSFPMLLALVELDFPSLENLLYGTEGDIEDSVFQVDGILEMATPLLEEITKRRLLRGDNGLPPRNKLLELPPPG